MLLARIEGISSQTLFSVTELQYKFLKKSVEDVVFIFYVHEQNSMAINRRTGFTWGEIQAQPWDNVCIYDMLIIPTWKLRPHSCKDKADMWGALDLTTITPGHRKFTFFKGLRTSWQCGVVGHFVLYCMREETLKNSRCFSRRRPVLFWKSTGSRSVKIRDNVVLFCFVFFPWIK